MAVFYTILRQLVVGGSKQFFRQLGARCGIRVAQPHARKELWKSPQAHVFPKVLYIPYCEVRFMDDNISIELGRDQSADLGPNPTYVQPSTSAPLVKGLALGALTYVGVRMGGDPLVESLNLNASNASEGLAALAGIPIVAGLYGKEIAKDGWNFLNMLRVVYKREKFVGEIKKDIRSAGFEGESALDKEILKDPRKAEFSKALDERVGADPREREFDDDMLSVFVKGQNDDSLITTYAVSMTYMASICIDALI
jgi:hypothetical protein